MTEESAQIPDTFAGQRLDQALAQMFPQYSRSRLKQWLVAGHIRVDGQILKPRASVVGGESVLLRAPAEPQVSSGPEAIELEFAFADEHLFVVNKPSGLVVHPGAGNTHGTLMNGLLHHDSALEQLPRAGIIHRIDKDTSGLLLVARSLEAHTVLTRMLADRDIARRYTAVCAGVLTGGGKIDAPIGRHPNDRTRMSVQERGRAAVTHYTVTERFRAHTLVDVKLETGRTHQIRVHFAHQRKPLLGDQVYGGRLGLPKGATPALADALRGFKRQALHARSLAFIHPMTDEQVEVVAPLPEDLEALIAVLRADTP